METKQDKISQVLAQNGAFWSFSDKQFNEQKKDNIKYVSMGSGLICPKENADKLNNELTQATKEIRQEEKDKLEARAKALKIEKLPQAERITNRKILIHEAIGRVQNYMDCDVIAEAEEELKEAQGEKIAEAIEYILNCINYRYNEREEVQDIYTENIAIIKELQAEIEAILKE